ncbi:hypothetical protein OG216_08595 [Streptomycetaceae bacterium NBC_01309]
MRSSAPPVWDGLSARSPFAHLEAAFAVLAAEPAPLVLAVDGTATALGVLAARGLLPGRSPAADVGADRVWAEILRRSRAGQAAWMVAAAGLALPGLRRTERRFGRLPPDDRDDVQQELLTAFLAAAGTVDTTAAHIARRLLRAADRAGQAWAHRRRIHTAAEHPLHAGAFPGADAAGGAVVGAAPAGHPDLVLARAVHVEVLDASEGELIGATRLGSASCARLAAVSGASSRMLQRRRKRAEERLAGALRDHRV